GAVDDRESGVDAVTGDVRDGVGAFQRDRPVVAEYFHVRRDQPAGCAFGHGSAALQVNAAAGRRQHGGADGDRAGARVVLNVVRAAGGDVITIEGDRGDVANGDRVQVGIGEGRIELDRFGLASGAGDGDRVD